MRVDVGRLRSLRALQWDAFVPALVCVALAASPAVPCAGQFDLGVRTLPSAANGREWRFGDALFAIVYDATNPGLIGAVLRVTEGARTREIALDGTRTGARARGVSDVRLLPEYRRVLLHLDRAHDASGLLVIDLAADSVVDAVVGRDLTPSPDGRFWAYEEHAARTVTQWPHTETVYAVYDAAAPPEANARACPTSDERCRGQVLFLPDRLTRCHEIARERGGSCLTPGRQPMHARRSPFVWLAPNEVAWVDVDLERQVATLVLATMFGGMPADVRAIRLERSRILEDVDVPPVREQWTIDRITRDVDPTRVWLHFRTRVPQAPLQRLGVRLSE